MSIVKAPEQRTFKSGLFKIASIKSLELTRKFNPVTGNIRFTAGVKEPAIPLLDSLFKRKKHIKQIKKDNSGRRYLLSSTFC